MGRKLRPGQAGGRASAAKLSPDERSARAKHANAARNAKLSPDQRKAIATKASRAYWSKIILTNKTPDNPDDCEGETNCS